MMVEPERISKFLSNVVQNGPVPEHIAFIMDGNRRYARRHGKKTLVGHYRGAVALENVKAPNSI
jgi:undecaprenyl pyrophosphate synthase